MKVSISKSKNTTIYYLSKSVRVGNKTTTKTVEKIGTYDEIKKKCGDMEPLEWAKKYRLFKACGDFSTIQLSNYRIAHVFPKVKHCFSIITCFCQDGACIAINPMI